MARHAKLIVAALATTLAATLGTMGVAASVDAGSKIHSTPMYRDASWCC